MHWPNPGRLVLLGLCASAWQLPPRSLTQRTRNSRHSSRLVPATYSSSSDDDVVDGGESPGFVILSRPFSLTDMLMQRAIQTQKHYYMELHNEPMSNWLGGFMDHSHLDRGSRWHSCMGLRTGLQVRNRCPGQRVGFPSWPEATRRVTLPTQHLRPPHA